VLSSAMSEAIVDNALAQRERLRSGRSRACGVSVLLILVGIGVFCALVIGQAKGRFPDGGWRVFGWSLAGVCGSLLVPVVVKLDPSTPWGHSIDEVCPWCHKRELRERRCSHSVTHGRIRRTYTGIVTLCTPECGFSRVKRA
jgi:hypothetical protein